nr:Heavy metal efflux pump, CzcA family [Methylocystis sp. SC2]
MKVSERRYICAETVGVSMAGLAPILWSAGAGSEIMQLVAVPMIGRMARSTVLTLVVSPRSIC